jgi:hypothetical protein
MSGQAPSVFPAPPGLTLGAAAHRVSAETDDELAASVDLSPDRHGTLEAARMEPEHRVAQRVEITELDARFLAGFTIIRPTSSYLMRDVQVRWTRGSAPSTAAAGVVS